MKIKLLRPNVEQLTRDTKLDIHKVERMTEQSAHPFWSTREHTRALNSAKLERLFSKPLLGDLHGHTDSVQCLCRHPLSLSTLFSGSADGEIRQWNIPLRTCVRNVRAHDGFVRAVCASPDGGYLLSCGDDRTIKRWALTNGGPTLGNSLMSVEPQETIMCKHVVYSVDHQHQQAHNQFASCGTLLELWDAERTEPLRAIDCAHDTCTRVRFNPLERNILCALCHDRSVLLVDVRERLPLRRLVLRMRSNAIAWNPTRAFNFTLANEDYNLYTYDMRHLESALQVHTDHVAAVLDVDYSPSGTEFVSGGYDKVLRIFDAERIHSREVYFTKRMQRLSAVLWSGDARYILSGSDEMNIRIWRANASDKPGTLRPRERAALEYATQLKRRYAEHPAVRRVLRHRRLPRHVLTAAHQLAESSQSERRRNSNRNRNSRVKSVTPTVRQQQTVRIET